MEPEALAAAARQVVTTRLARRRLPRLEMLTSLEDGYQVQAAANALLEGELGRRIGHKIGGTTEAMRRYIHVTEPIAGEIFASQVHPTGAELRHGDYVRLGIETEIAVRLGREITPRAQPFGRDEVGQAVFEVMAAIELVDDRYEDFAGIGGPTLAADNAFDAGSLLGPPVRDWQELELGDLHARTFQDGVLVGEGFGCALYGHPLEALAWLANRRSSLGLGLAAGSFVSLGSITPVQWVDAPARYRIDVEALGAVEVSVV